MMQSPGRVTVESVSYCLLAFVLAALLPARMLAQATEPLGTDFQVNTYTTCIYDNNGLVGQVEVPAGGVLWTANTKGFRYKDKAGSNDSITGAGLKSGAAGKASVSVKGKGTGLPDIILPLVTEPITVQLTNSETHVCFGAEFSGAEIYKREPGMIKAKGS
jgi:hypothetical protein